MTDAHVDADEAASAMAYAQMRTSAMFDLAAPQQRYLDVIAQGGYLEAVDGLAISFSRANTEYVLRHADEFSSHVDMGLGNVRPLIPLNVDPPQHSKYRKLLDPLFAPKRMDEQEEDITRRVNGFIDAFIDRGECNFTEEFAEVFPSSVFLGLMGLPEDEMRMFLDMRDGILHPEKRDPDALFDMDVRDARDERDRPGDLRVLRQPDRRAHAASPTDDIITRFVNAEIDGEQADTRRHPRHLLPVPHRRSRHGERHAHVLVRVPRDASRAPADDRRRPRDHPERGGGVAALGVAGPDRGPAPREVSGRPAERPARRRRHRR